ncbi:MAG: serine/threonine-protein kinase [Cyanobacteria bacterium P01_B01_bin.77]
MNSRHQRSSYRLLGLVGNGQFGRVYCGVHRKTGQLVAIKYLHRHSLSTHAFLRELHCLLSLAHPNIVVCHALEHSDEGRRLVLEYCVGGTLRSHMLSPLRLADILDLITDVLCGLAHAHQQGIVHCDIKPENILLGYRDGRWRAKISDFGIAKLIQEQPHRKGSGQTGSPAYMAPERFYCQYSPAADVYAVGIMLFELLVGQRPFSGTPTTLQSAHLNQPVPKINQLIEPFQSKLQPIVTKALEKLPARRYPTAAEMLVDLKDVVVSQETDLYLPLSQTKTVYHSYTGDPWQPLTQSVGNLEELSLSSVNPPVVLQMLMSQDCQLAVLQQRSITVCSQVLDSPIQGLYPSRSGLGLIVSTQKSLWSGIHADLLTPLIRWSMPAMVAVEPHHRWAATVTPSTKQLVIVQLKTSHLVAHPIRRPLPPDIDINQVIAIDSGHLAIVGHGATTGTQLQLWNRRGMYLTSLNLGITLDKLIPMQSSHQWMAVDVHAPQTIIFLTLKPLRMTRITLDICPTVMLELPWGYLFCNDKGHILLLDRDLSAIGGIQGPPNVTAIAPMSSHELLVATWQLKMGGLHCLDLRDFDLDIIF